MSQQSQSPSLFRTVAAIGRTLRQDLFGTYRPERHYMRGPGPKWHAKHGIPAVAAPASATLVTVRA